MTILTTPRLRLEPFKNSHLEELYYLNSDISVMQYITGRTVSLEETLEHMDLVKKNWTQLGFSSWSFIDRETGEFVGTGGIQHIEFNPDNPLEIGWRLKPSKWHRGYATEAAKTMMEFIFEKINIDALYAVCHQDNKSSVGVMQRLGMRYEGIEHWYGLDVLTYKMPRKRFEFEQIVSRQQQVQPMSSLAVSQ
ncbi:RimJ/RimL family protein N-acetyltransferase [Oxalobacteraceae bacterium GrIS 2.11]